MRCRYCFYTDVAEARATPNRGMMALDTLETLVKQAFSEAEHFISFGFQGGEPMLAGLEFFEAFAALETQYNTKGIEVVHSIQTNGTLIDKAWARFFAKNDFLVGLSIDGERKTHDLLRQDVSGAETFDRCMAAADLLREAGADFNILTVVTNELALHPDELWDFYHANDLRFVQLIPCLDGLDEEHGSNPYSLEAQVYGEFLCRFFDRWYECFIKGDYISVRAFDNWVRMLMGQAPENCGMAGTCAAYPVVEADGSVYPCDFYVLDEYKLGTVQKDTFASMLGGEAAQEFMQPSRTPHDDCLNCEYAVICRGGCRRDREPIKDGRTSLNYYCEGYKKFFEHVLPRMNDIAQNILINTQKA